jgi:hypothetical protein
VSTDMMNIYLNEMVKKYPGKEILLIMDQAPWHKSNSLELEEFSNIRIKFLPPILPN